MISVYEYEAVLVMEARLIATHEDEVGRRRPMRYEPVTVETEVRGDVVDVEPVANDLTAVVSHPRS